ncbi:NACHT domain- and WD repeat-containing protein 1-like isoform X2 [Ptychodera flava]|uniref:NACHT domain- and WD repeat-containing protein 1-like isoform X2 n=1 Tax=Ptychodera flava TaxID=63121 RepID=UPI00396A9F0B
MDESSLYKALLQGDMERLPAQESNTVRIFISSTFTDMAEERNKLMREAFPIIRTYCQSKGLEFEVVDMRWGIRDEASSDHMTSELCIREISNCQRLSKGPNFVVFLGNKYGYRPLPPRIKAEEFEKLRDLAEATASQEDMQLLNDWYLKDTNAVPEEYVLQPITTYLKHFNNEDEEFSDLRMQDRQKWWQVLQTLQTLLKMAADTAIKTGVYDEEKVEALFISVTEEEVTQAIIRNPEAADHCLCFVREIEDAQGIVTDEEAKHYVDLKEESLLDEEAQALLAKLKREKLISRMSKGIVRKWSVPWTSNGMDPSNPRHKEYLEALCDEFIQSIKQLIEKGSNKQTNKVPDDALYKEVVHHAKFCETKCRSFRGRQSMLESVEEYVKNFSKNKPLCIHGASGSGKTSVMAMVAQSSRKWLRSTGICVLRFLGTSPQSTAIHQTLQSICKQICEAYGHPPPNEETLGDYTATTQYFKKLLDTIPSENAPLVLVLDSIDQLSSTHDSHALNWLPKTLPSHVRIVVSMLPDVHGCLESLRRNLPDKQCYMEMQPLTGEMGKDILDAWLESRQRQITEKQRETILTSLEKCPQPLFLKIAFDNLIHWKSYTPAEDTAIANTVREAIEVLFSGLEKKYGQVFVSRALAYITAAKDGITEAELEDVLSLDDTVLGDVYQYWDPPSEDIVRIPPLLWKRTRYEVDEYLVERQAGGKTVLAWYHRQFIEAAQKRYLGDKDKAEIHSMLAEYFLGTYADGKCKFLNLVKRKKILTNADRQVASQPLEYQKGVFNLRKLSELPYHLLHAGNLEKLKEEVLCRFDWILTKLRGTSFLEVIQDYNSVLEVVEDETVQLVHDGLMLAGSNLKSDPLSLAGQVIGRLHGITGQDHQLVVNLVEQAFEWCHKTELPLLVPKTGCLIPPGGPLKTTLAGHVKRLEVVAMTNDMKHIVSCCEVSKSECMLNVWDFEKFELVHVLKAKPGGKPHAIIMNDQRKVICGAGPFSIFSIESGELLQTVGSSDHKVVAVALSQNDECLYTVTDKNQLKIWEILHNKCKVSVPTSHQGNVTQLCVSNDGRFAVTAGQDHVVKVWDTTTGEIRGNFEGHSKPISCLTIAPDNSTIISGSEDSSVKIWKVDATDKNLVASIQAHSKQVSVVKLIRGGTLLLSGSKDQTLKLWDVQTQVCLQVYRGHQDVIWCLAVTKDEKMMVSGSKDDLLKLWDIDTGECLITYEGHSSWISCVCVTSDGQHVISGSNDKTVKIWKITKDTNALHRERHETQPTAVSITSNGTVAISAAPNDTTRIWSFETGKDLHVLQNDSACIALMPDDSKLATGSADKVIRVWNLQSGEIVHSLEGHERGIACLTVTHDNRYLLSACKGNSIRKWDLYTGESFPEWTGHDKPIKGLAVTPDNSKLISGSSDGSARLWDINNGECLRILTGHTGSVDCIAISPNGSYIATGSMDKTMRVWNVNSGKCVDEVTDFDDSVKCNGFTHDSSLVVAGSHESNRQLKMWHVDSKGHCKLAKEFKGHHHAVMVLHITEDDRFLLSGSRDCTLKVWDLKSAILLTSFDFQSQVKLIGVSREISPDSGSYKVFAANKSGMVGFFDLQLKSALQGTCSLKTV